MLYIMRFKTVIGSTTSQGRECVFGFKTERSLPNEEIWNRALRNVQLQLNAHEYIKSLSLEKVETE
ncbi:hypothetical protein [Ruminococcus sp.]|uniref:hypothetical protein n=1 Tax=Ruminococcus sp. TaxID=41978 RepID=UPI001B40F91C|nr:hypothetical protein [Ruminococcus sp.]MBP5432191.1 hypothetical protein [Ruminococcus sp.]